MIAATLLSTPSDASPHVLPIASPTLTPPPPPPPTPRPTVAGELAAWRFARVRDYIERNLGEAMSLEDLARVAGISRFHFARQFRARTGASPMEYLLRTRVERAKTLLRDSHARVVDISAELGFADQSHFARAFRRMVGMPPSTYARITARISVGDEG